VKRLAVGRLLRAPTVFEDVMKTICTTNCTWAFSKVMAANLCRALGASFNSSLHAFPTVADIAHATEPRLRKEARTGYRSPYLLDLSRKILKGELALEGWRNSDRTTEQLREEIQVLRGVGAYCTAYILNWVGRFECLTIDRWMRKKFYETYCDGKPVSDDTIIEHYKKFGRWSGLFFWVDMTREWLAP
jgi:N-glycosylase/DNA lyase